jgi:hypothetical protein
MLAGQNGYLTYIREADGPLYPSSPRTSLQLYILRLSQLSPPYSKPKHTMKSFTSILAVALSAVTIAAAVRVPDGQHSCNPHFLARADC